MALQVLWLWDLGLGGMEGDQEPVASGRLCMPSPLPSPPFLYAWRGCSLTVGTVLLSPPTPCLAQRRHSESCGFLMWWFPLQTSLHSTAKVIFLKNL